MRRIITLSGPLLLLLLTAPAGAFDFGRALDIAGSAVKVGQAASKAAEDFTPEQEYYIGRAVAANILGQYRPWDNPGLNRYLNLLGQSLARSSNKPQTFGGYHFLALDSPEVNAFACPGGLVLVSRGLIDLCQSEDDLSAVLAHEVGHVQLEHGIKAIKQSRSTELGKVLLAEGAKQATGSGAVGQLVGLLESTIGDVLQTLVVNGYSREQELEADRAGIIVTTRTGYQPQGMVRVLTQMEARFKTDKAGFAKTHPAPAERAKELAALLGQTPAFSPVAAREARFAKEMGR